MSMIPRRRSRLFGAGALMLVVLASSLASDAASPWAGVARSPERARAAIAADRYDMAGGCYAIRASNGAYVKPAGDGFAASTPELGAAEPFHLQATDLGSYLFYAKDQKFLAASEGAPGDAADAVTGSQPGKIAGGVVLEQTDAAAAAAKGTPANVGRGTSIVAASKPSELADWVVDGTSGAFTITLPATQQRLSIGAGGRLEPAATSTDTFSFELTTGCATYPEVEVNVEGDILGGQTSHQEVRGYLEAHLHMMAFEFLGGRARCGRPWHRYGAAFALVDCPDHLVDGRTGVLENVVSNTPTASHTPDGWPSFRGWPKHNSLTHEQVYYKWLERSWRGGLRMFVNLLVDNNQLCKIYPYKRNSCNEMDGVRLQAQRIRELERYIDAQSGGPGEGWFRIVTDPYQARAVINQGKLAVVLGIEVSVPLDCGLTLDLPRCDLDDIDERLDQVYDLGVRQMELVNKFDNALSGVTGDAGPTGIVVNQGNLGETGRFWRMETCNEQDGHAHDKRQMNFADDSGAPDEVFGRDSLVGAILKVFGTSGAAPLYPEGPHCNILGLSQLGEAMIRGMVERGMIFDPDHMSARARTQAVDLIKKLDHSGIMSSHGWADDTIYPRIYELGGVVTPHAGGSTSFVAKWAKHKAWADERYFWGLGYGADTNGFSTQGGPRGANAANKVEYPFTGFGGVTIHQQVSGTRTYDINTDGVAHYGLYPDWMEDLRRQAGDQIIADMERGPEAYLQMWERAIGIEPDACRADLADLSDEQVAAVATGMTPQQVLETVGQPNTRVASTFTYCVAGSRKATVSFSTAGTVSGVVIA